MNRQANIQIESTCLITDLQQVLDLQASNHRSNLNSKQQQQNGFVTVKHDLATLQKMTNYAPQIVAKDDDKVVGYALVMYRNLYNDIPVLIPMFNMLSKLSYEGKKLDDSTYYVMGQVCVADGYRGMGIFDQLYQKHRDSFSKQFEYCITEISNNNIRSMKAHERVGFKTIHSFVDTTDQWNIVLWDWR